MFISLLADTVDIVFGYDQYGGAKDDIRKVNYIINEVNYLVRFGFQQINMKEFTTFPFIKDVSIDMDCCPIIIIDTDVLVRETPSLQGKIIGKISMECAFSTPDFGGIPESYENKDEKTLWMHVYFTNGWVGWVLYKHCITFADYGSVVVRKVKTKWRITSVSTHPGC